MNRYRAAMDSSGATTGRIAVCSWSLRPTSGADLAEKVRACGLRHVQLALDPIRSGHWNEQETVEALRAADIAIVSGMMAPAGEDYSTLETIRESGGLRPEVTWDENLDAAAANAALARRLGVETVTLHAGCVPEEPKSPLRKSMLRRLREVCAIFGVEGVRVAFETGQDAPSTMIGVLESLYELRVGVNFDPANMILYGSADPIDALRALAPWVVQAHIKDAKPTGVPGTWGEEVAAGSGAVDWPRFFGAIRERLPGIDLVIEREAGEQRVEDVTQGVHLVRRLR